MAAGGRLPELGLVVGIGGRLARAVSGSDLGAAVRMGAPAAIRPARRRCSAAAQSVEGAVDLHQRHAEQVGERRGWHEDAPAQAYRGQLVGGAEVVGGRALHAD